MSDKTDKLMAKFDNLKNLYGPLHAQMEKNRNYYDLKFGVDVIPGDAQNRGFEPVIPPTARQAIDEAADHILYFPKLRVPVRPVNSEHISAQEIAEKKRQFITSWWRQVTQRSNPIGDGRKTLLNEGMIAVRSTLRWDLIPDKDKLTPDEYRSQMRKLGHYDFLWDVQLLDNKTVFPDPSNHRDPKYVFLQYKVYKEEAERLFPDASGEWVARGDFDELLYTEYWSAPKFKTDGTYDPGDYVRWIETDCVADVENPYPYVPIAIEDAGFGQVHHLAKVDDKFKGFSEFTHSVFVAQARQWSAMEAVAELTAFAPFITRNLDEGKVQTLKLGPGEVWNLHGAKDDPTSESIEFAQMPVIPATVPQMIGLTDRAANATLKMEVLGGIPQTGVDTATEADQNQRNATAKLQGPISGLERLIAKLSKWAFMDIELTLAAPVTVYGVSADDPGEVSLSTKDISGYYECSAQLTTTDEDAISQSKARFWLEMALRTPFLSYFTAMERGGVTDDPQEEMVRRAAEEVFLSPEFRAIRTMTGAQSFGELAEMLQQMQKPAEPQMAGGGLNAAQTPGADPLGGAPPAGLTSDSAYDTQTVTGALRGAAGGSVAPV